MAIKSKKPSTKAPPIFSNEFIIQNHADIVSCVAMVFVIGFFVNATQPYAAPFVTLQHNVTEIAHGVAVQYASGVRDLCFIFFATLIMIVLHAILQEYVLDKLCRKVHLSKAKMTKFHASGQLLAFFALSAVWAANILNNEGGVLPLSSLWAGFPGAPHDSMGFAVKLFFISQVAYWLHMFAELYFERVKREEYLGRIAFASAHCALFFLAYGLNLWRVGLVLSVVYYGEQSLFHVARLAHFFVHPAAAKLFSVWNLVFVAARLVTLSLAVLVFWFGLPSAMFTLRVAGLSLIGATQLYMLFAFLAFHIGRVRQWRQANQKPAKGGNKGSNKSKAAKQQQVDKSLPEAEQSSAPSSPAASPKAASKIVQDDSKMSSPKDSGNVKKRLKARA